MASAQPPHVDQAERIVLGAMMLSPGDLEQVTDRLTSSSFYSPTHEMLYAQIVAAWAAGEPTEPVALAERLHAEGELGRLDGGAAYLHTLIGSVPTSAQAGHYAGIVAEAAENRYLVEQHLALGQALQIPDPGLRAQRIAAIVEKIRTPVAVRGGRRLVATTAADMQMKAATWLYDRRIPAGAFTLLAGREGIGKSTISYDLVARITRGQLPGRHEGIPRSVAVVAGEDDWEAVIVPRLVAARVDLRRVHRVEARTEVGRPDTLSLPVDLDQLTQLCEKLDIVLVVIDPIMSVIHSGLDTYKDRDVRQALDPMARFAATSEVAVLGLIHLNKSNDRNPLDSVMASKAFTAVARSVLYCLADPDDDSDEAYLFCHAKSNLGPKQPTLRYHLSEVKIELDNPAEGGDPVIVTSRVVWDGEDERSLREALQGAPVERPAGPVATSLEEWVISQGRTVSTSEITAEFPDVKRATLDQNLARLVKRGKLSRPVHGHYAPPSDTRSDTPHPSCQMAEVSEVSDDLDDLTLLTELTPDRRTDPVSERVSEPERDGAVR